jgi:hypothetical protein
MNTRKRKLSAVDRTTSSVDTAATQAKPSTAPCGSLSDLHLNQLRQIGCTKTAISAVAAATLHVAAKAFRGQLEVFSKQLPDGRYVGFHTSPGVQRLEYRPGHEALGDLGILQHLVVTVHEPCVMHCNCATSACSNSHQLTVLSCIYSHSCLLGSANLR